MHTPAKSKGTLLTYRNNFVPASEPLLAGNEQPAFRQARLNGLGSQHTLLHYAVSSPSGHTQGISESPRPVFPVIQQRPLFSVMDRAYLDFERLYLMHQIGAFFLTRAKKNLRAHRVYSARKDGKGGVLADQTIALDGPASRRRYPAHLRRIRYRDPASGKTLVFLTNRTDLEALTICDLYKSRWQVELFFKWIKQHLRIKRFFGTSENAVKSQLWVAVSVYVLVATIRKQLGIETPLYAILQILSVLPFEQVPLYEVLTKSESRSADKPLPDQLPLFAP